MVTHRSRATSAELESGETEEENDDTDSRNPAVSTQRTSLTVILPAGAVFAWLLSGAALYWASFYAWCRYCRKVRLIEFERMRASPPVLFLRIIIREFGGVTAIAFDEDGSVHLTLCWWARTPWYERRLRKRVNQLLDLYPIDTLVPVAA